MSDIFNTANGTFNLDTKLTFLAGMTLGDVKQKGVKFVREFDMKTGWVFCTAGPYDVSGHGIYLSLGFEGDKLQRVGLSFISKIGDDVKDLREKHDRFLLQELGKPSEKNDYRTLYRFPWGEITSEFDPRGGSSQILIRWT